MYQFHKFIFSWNSTCFGQFLCLSSMQVCRQLSSRIRMELQWINSWWWTEELSETCRVSCQNKFVKSVHLVGFIIKKYVTLQHGHMNGKYYSPSKCQKRSTKQHITSQTTQCFHSKECTLHSNIKSTLNNKQMQYAIAACRIFVGTDEIKYAR
jgi:hypothetical protein